MLRNGRNENELVFSWHAPEAKMVFLAGSFNGWNRAATPMQRQEGDIWTVRLRLPTGYYEYKFVLDSDWAELSQGTPEDGHHCVPNSFGSNNCWLETRERAD